MSGNSTRIQTEELISKLAEKNNTPKGVEHFGLEPIPEKLKTVRWYDLFGMFAAFIINPTHLLLAGTAVTVTGLSFWGAILSQVIGISIAFLAFCTFATAGVKYGLTGAVATRFSLGIYLSKYGPSILRAATSVFYFAASTLAGGLAIQALLKSLTGSVFSLMWISLIFAIFQTLIAIVGFESLKKTTRFVFPLKVIGMGYIVYAFMHSDLPNFQFSHITGMSATHPGWGAFALSASTMAGIYFTLITDASDFCRYTRSKADMWIGVMSGALFSITVISFIGAYSAIAIGNWNAFDAMTILNPSTAILLFLLILVVLDNWTINILNLYTAGLCLVNAFPSLGRFRATIISGVVATIASCFPIFITNANPIMGSFGLIYSPLVGVIIADFLFLKKMKVNVPALFDPKGQYRFTDGINWIAVITIAVGCFTFSFWPTSLIPSLANALFCMVFYWVLVKLVSPYWKSVSFASQPFEGHRDDKKPEQEFLGENRAIV